MHCVICGIRKPRRACPGVRGDICALCCGREREQSVDCPLDCEYLRQAHEFEQVKEVEDAEITDPSVRLDDGFVKRNQWLLMILGSSIIDAYRQIPAITDFDAREALAALVRTWQTRESGLIYEATPQNPYAGAICDSVRETVARLQVRLAKTGESLKDSTFLQVLVFLRRLEILENNGRKRSRSFLDMLNRGHVEFPPESEPVEPEASRIIL